VKWKAKLGSEARLEIATNRMVWAVGNHADEDYFLPVMLVDNPPVRGQALLGTDGLLHKVRLKRYLKIEDRRSAVGAQSLYRNARVERIEDAHALVNSWDRRIRTMLSMKNTTTAKLTTVNESTG